MFFQKNKQGFTLIELLIVIGIIAILAGIVIVAINPKRQFAMANNTERQAEVKTILNALNQYTIDQRGSLLNLLPVGYTRSNILNIVTGTGLDATEISLSPLVPTYLVPDVPFDPAATSAHDTGYDLVIENDGTLKISAPLSELNVPIIFAGRAS